MLWVQPDFAAETAGGPAQKRGSLQERGVLNVAAPPAYAALAALEPIDRYVEKQGRSTGRYRVGVNGRAISVYIKKYFRLPWWQRWFGRAERYPGPRELQNLRRVAELGIAVPEAIVAGADRRHPCKSLLAVRDLEGFTPLHEYIPAMFGGEQGSAVSGQRSGAGGQSSHDRLRKRRLTEQLAKIARTLHGARLYHLDLYLCHFFVREAAGADGHFELALIDFLRLKRSQCSRWRVKDLAQLLYSSDLPGITRTDRVRFFKRYLGVRRLDRAARRLLRRVERKTASYRRHNGP